MAQFEKCPYCGAWRLRHELTTHIGACITHGKAGKYHGKPSPAEKPKTEEV